MVDRTLHRVFRYPGTRLSSVQTILGRTSLRIVIGKEKREEFQCHPRFIPSYLVLENDLMLRLFLDCSWAGKVREYLGASNDGFLLASFSMKETHYARVDCRPQIQN